MRNEWQAAEDALKEAVQLFEKVGDDNRHGQALGNLGDFYAFRGDSEEAAHYYSDGAELLARSGDRDKQAQLLRALSLLRLRQRRMTQSVFLMQQSLEARTHLNPLQRVFLSLIKFLGRVMGGRS